MHGTVRYEFSNLCVCVKLDASVILQVQPARIYLFITYRLNLVIRSYLQRSHLLEMLSAPKSS